MAAPRVTIDALPDQPALVPTDLLVVQDGTTTRKMALSVLTTPGTTALNAHINGLTDAHDASAISAVAGAAPMVGTDVQTQLTQAAVAVSSNTANIAANTTAITTNATNLTTHTTRAAGAHAATAVSVSPAINGAADVQAALTSLNTKTGIPVGGATGQVLTKITATDGDAGWRTNIPVPIGGTTGQVLAKASTNDGDTNWITPAAGGGGGSLTALQVAAQLQLVVLNATDAAPGPGVWLRRP